MASHHSPVLVVIGPSGSGKSTVVRRLVDRGLITVHPTWTTRHRRPDEAAGWVEHAFCDDAEFDRRERDGFFVRTAQPFGLPYRYGLPRITPGAAGHRRDCVMLRAPFVAAFAALVPDIVVFQIEAGAAEVAARLRRRGEGEPELRARLIAYHDEVRTGRQLADRIFVNDGCLDTVVAAVSGALTMAVAA
jgi:guanylate kinase